MTLQRTRIVYPDGSDEFIVHYGMFCHNSGGFGFYKYDPDADLLADKDRDKGYIFVSGANVRKIIPMGAV